MDKREALKGETKEDKGTDKRKGSLSKGGEDKTCNSKEVIIGKESGSEDDTNSDDCVKQIEGNKKCDEEDEQGGTNI